MKFDPDSITQEKLHELRRAAEHAWSDETRPVDSQGHPQPSAGQCYVTSKWLQSKLGGGHVGTKDGHFFWVSPDRHYVVDLTGDQNASAPAKWDARPQDEEDEPYEFEPEQMRHRPGPIIYTSADNPLYRGLRIPSDPQQENPNTAERAQLFAERANAALEGKIAKQADSGGSGSDAYPGESPQAIEEFNLRDFHDPVIDDLNLSMEEPAEYEYKFVYGNGELKVSPADSHEQMAEETKMSPEATGPMAFGHINVRGRDALWSVETNMALRGLVKVMKDYTKNIGWKWGGLVDSSGQPIHDDFGAKKSFWYGWRGGKLKLSTRPFWGNHAEIEVVGRTASFNCPPNAFALPGLEEWAKDFGYRLAGIEEWDTTIPYEEEPLYHGTPKLRNVEDINNNGFRKGFLTSEPKEAYQYAGLDAGQDSSQNVTQHRVRFERPLHLTAEDVGMDLITGALLNHARQAGHDGIVIHRNETGPNALEPSQEWGEHRHVIPLDPATTRAATGTNVRIGAQRLAEYPGGTDMNDRIKNKEWPTTYDKGDPEADPGKAFDGEPQGDLTCPYCNETLPDFKAYVMHTKDHQDPDAAPIDDGHFPTIRPLDEPLGFGTQSQPTAIPVMGAIQQDSWHFPLQMEGAWDEGARWHFEADALDPRVKCPHCQSDETIRKDRVSNGVPFAYGFCRSCGMNFRWPSEGEVNSRLR